MTCFLCNILTIFFAACIKHFWMLVLDALNIRQCWTFGVNIRQYWTFGVLNLRMLLRICAFPRMQAQKSANALTDLCFFHDCKHENLAMLSRIYVFFFFKIENTKICECSYGFVRFHECKHEILRMLLRISALCMYPLSCHTHVCVYVTEQKESLLLHPNRRHNTKKKQTQKLQNDG